MATVPILWQKGGGSLTVAIGPHTAEKSRPAGTLEFNAIVDTGYDLSMVPGAKVNALKLPKVRDGSSKSPLGSVPTSIHRGSLWLADEALLGDVEFSVEDSEWGLVGQNILLGHMLRQTGPDAGKLGVVDASGGPVVATGHARLKGPVVKLAIGPAIPKGGKKPVCIDYQCTLDTAAGGSIISPIVRKTLRLGAFTGTRLIKNRTYKEAIPEGRVSVWLGDICLLNDYAVGEKQPNYTPVLLGQDFLTWCDFTQDGPNKTVRLQF